MPAAMSDVLREVAAERAAQDARWGEQNHPDGTGQWVHEQTSAGLARESCQKAAAAGEVTWRHILREEYYEALAESVPGRLRAELLQVAAVAVAWVEAIDRRALATALCICPPDDGMCSCESYDCQGECCGPGQCSCTPTDDDDEDGCDCIPGLGCPHVDDEVPWPDDVFLPRPAVTVRLPAEDVT